MEDDCARARAAKAVERMMEECIFLAGRIVDGLWMEVCG